jgi:hypothetical protein
MKHWRWRDVSEAAECIGGAWRWIELMGLTEQIELEVNTKHRRQSKWSELVRNCQDRMELVWGYFCRM